MMNIDLTIDSMIILLAAGSSAYLALYGLARSPRSWSHRLFAAGMTLLAVETLIGGLALEWGNPSDRIWWFRLTNILSSVLPGIWLLFALAFGESDFKGRLRRWKGFVLALFILPPLFAVFFPGSFFMGEPYITPAGGLIFSLGWSGYAFKVVFVLGSVLVMVALENTLRSSKGVKRWQVKFLTLGVLGYFAVRVYAGSQALLFHSLDLNLEITFPAAALILANLLIVVTFVRARVFPEDIYLSGEFIHRSVILFLVGGYLVMAGLLAKVLALLGGPIQYRVLSFLVFTALVFLAAILFSDRLRFTLKRQVSLHFQRPTYNYKDIWMNFTQRTSSAGDIQDLAGRSAVFISEIMEILSVSIWIFGDNEGEVQLSGSTSMSTSVQVKNSLGNGTEQFREFLLSQKKPFDFLRHADVEIKKHSGEYGEPLDAEGMRYCVPLWAADDLLGFVALGKRVGDERLGMEEFELLGTVGDQMAASIQNLRLSEQLQYARQLETLREFSSFFVHDLKNLASKLSMMLQNFPAYYDNPSFREDALVLVAQSVEKMNLLTRRMSELREAPEIRTAPANLPDVVRSSVSDFEPPSGVSILEEHQQLPDTVFDAGQMGKVVTNLVLNAIEAVGDTGNIGVRTFIYKGWVVLEVKDDGPGMEEEFISQSLFKPFKTTKENGLGIGLFQCRTLVEAHGGTISVRSRPGQGATFQVHLPLPRSKEEVSSREWSEG